MLKKLLKYEYKATARTFLGLYLAIILSGVFMATSARFSGAGVFNGMGVSYSEVNPFGNNAMITAMSIISLCYVGLIIAMFVVLVVTICQRFSRNLLGAEGYLMHTLPVDVTLLIVSKFIIALLWAACSVVVLLVSMYLIFFIITVGLPIDFSWFQIVIESGIANQFWMLLPAMLLSFCSFVSSAYLAMMIGHQFKKGTVVVSIIAYFVINNVASWVGLLISWLVSITPLAGLIMEMPFGVSYAMACVLQAALAFVYLLATKYFMCKHLNLE